MSVLDDTDADERLLTRWGVAFPIPFDTTVDVALLTQECLLVGWSIREPTGVAAVVADIVGGGLDAADMLAVAALPISGAVTSQVPGGGMACPRGVGINIVSGELRGALWVRIAH